jgi:hypothetical protein
MNKSKVNNNSIQYNDVHISIDTMYLVAYLTDEQKEFLYDRIVFQKNNKFKDQYFHYSQEINNIVIKTTPRKSFTNAHYNTMIIFKKDTSHMYIPYSIREILQFDWQYKRLDLAFDFNTEFNKRAIIKHHGNIAFDNSNKDWNTDYMHALKSKTETKVACYDRNEKERSNNTEVIHTHPTRFEVRLFHKLNKFNSIHNIDHGWIENKLSKYIFIPDIESLPLNRWRKRDLYKIQSDYDYLKTLDKSKQKEIKQTCKANRVPLEQIYLHNKDNLFSFLYIEPLNEFSNAS